MTHQERVSEIVAKFESNMGRFLARVESAPIEAAERAPAHGGWSVAGIAWHVAATNEAFTGLVTGAIPQAEAAAPDFLETPFGAIAAEVPDKMDAPKRFHPPADVKVADVVGRLRTSQAALVQALRAMPESRATWTVQSILGRITLCQVGEWAAAHVARHNAQAKRALG